MILIGESKRANFIMHRICFHEILLTSSVFAILVMRNFKLLAFKWSKEIDNFICFNMIKHEH